MKVNHVLGLIALFAVPLTASLAGCSSSSTTTFPDGGGTGSSSGTTGSSGGSSGGFGSSSGTTGSSSGAGSSSSGTTSSGTDAGSMCTAATTVPSTMIPPYVAPKQQLNACTAAQLMGFAGACLGATGSAAACNSEQMTLNTSAPTCLSCLFGVMAVGDAGAPSNTGAVIFDYTGMSFFSSNVPGCIALEDPTNGPMCGAQLEPLFQCELQACNSAGCQTATAAQFGACVMASQTGACSTQASGVNTSCKTDLGDGGAGSAKCGTDQQVLNAICGTGMN